MTVNKAYAGTYTYEGHDVHFSVLENGMTMLIEEIKDGKSVISKHVPLDEAVDYQDQLVKWGYVSY
tara:strand:- start:37 stop:234 length:198 start_codon:yes stop_codon:yes gene_type:complete